MHFQKFFFLSPMCDIDYGLIESGCLFTRDIFSSANMNFSYMQSVAKPFGLSKQITILRGKICALETKYKSLHQKKIERGRKEDWGTQATTWFTEPSSSLQKGWVNVWVLVTLFSRWRNTAFEFSDGTNGVKEFLGKFVIAAWVLVGEKNV